MKKIAVVEDDEYIGNMVEELLRGDGFDVLRAYSGSEALLLLGRVRPDLVLLDLMLPGASGEAVLESAKKLCPVIILSAKTDVGGKVKNLNAGASDYITKPFEPDELLARVRAMLRRKDNFTPDILTFHDTVLNRSTYELIFEESAQILSGKEFQVMEVLMQKPGVIVPTEEFMTHIWGWNTSVDTSVVWVHISNIRRKIEKIKAPVRIRFIRNAGYVLEADV